MKRVKVLSLKPTQFAVGMLEVDEKIALVAGFTRKQLKAFVRDNPVPVVMGPDGEMYIVDHHHFLAVCYHVGVKKVFVDIVKDLSKSRMSYPAFWKWMAKTRHAYPFCQFGEGPRKALYLPRDIRGVADDPYRSLAWFVRKAGAFENSDKNFAEFKWANFFRERGLLDRSGPRGMAKALRDAVKLAQSPAARRLPGFGKLEVSEQAKVRKNVEARSHQLKKQKPVIDRARVVV